mgnify:FL=1
MADADEHHLLGSMLPDFEAMLRVPLITVRDPDIRRGIDLHHRTDDAFHRSPVFVEIGAGALSALTATGVRRGTARAVGHIGTEMFLDGWLARDQAHVDLYLAALGVELGERLHWGDAGLAFATLRRRLTTWGAPRDYAEPGFVLQRLTDALARRPALAVLDEESARVADFLPFLQERVEKDAPELLHRVQDALGLRD